MPSKEVITGKASIELVLHSKLPTSETKGTTSPRTKTLLMTPSTITLHPLSKYQQEREGNNGEITVPLRISTPKLKHKPTDSMTMLAPIHSLRAKDSHTNSLITMTIWKPTTCIPTESSTINQEGDSNKMCIHMIAEEAWAVTVMEV